MVLSLKKIYPIEGLTLLYTLFTALYMIAWPGATDAGVLLQLLGIRLLVVVAIVLLLQFPVSKITAFVRQIWPLAFIIYWYPETYYIHSCFFGNLDGFFMQLDASWFGCQPALAFSRIMPWYWMNELMNFAYLSYYFIIAGTVLYLYLQDAVNGFKAAFILMSSFFIYYILFILIPVMGPQFYWPSPENSIPYTVPFRATMCFLQSMGEKPTGAFPSSHVGITTVCMFILFFQNGKKLFYWFLPLAILLIASTVYIKAHYLVDVIGGLFTAPLLYWLSVKVWENR